VKRHASSACRLLFTAALVAPLVGCVCCVPSGACGHGGGIVGWSAHAPCFGYYPTCWRPWPIDCPPCPPPYGVEPHVEWGKPPVPPVEPMQPMLPRLPDELPDPPHAAQPDAAAPQVLPEPDLAPPAPLNRPLPPDQGLWQPQLPLYADPPEAIQARSASEGPGPNLLAAPGLHFGLGSRPYSAVAEQPQPEPPPMVEARFVNLPANDVEAEDSPAPIVTADSAPQETSSRRYWIEGRYAPEAR
jgi:hypothetical protein